MTVMTRTKAAAELRVLKAACCGDEQQGLRDAFDNVIDGLMSSGVHDIMGLKEAKERVENAWGHQFSATRDKLPMITMIKLVREVFAEGRAAGQSNELPEASAARLILSGTLLRYITDDDAALTHKSFLRMVADRIYDDQFEIGHAVRPVNETIIKDIARRAVDAISDGWGEKEDASVAALLEGFFREAARRA